MEQERIVCQIGRASMVIGEFLLKLLYLATCKAYEVHTDKASLKQFTGHTDWNKLMATRGRKEVQDLLNNEVNLKAFKGEMSRAGVGFATQKNPDGTVRILYEFKNKQVVETAMKKVVESIARDPKTMAERLKKTPRNMTPDEKINYYGEKMKQHMKQAREVVATQQLTQGKGKSK
ncbi:hypothetical protein P7J41_05530 [Streptococcus suis]|uniref:hypothetical protein n=1 Tax=Streptococcus suis TaxID=1307 RepID=UPI0038B7F320